MSHENEISEIFTPDDLSAALWRAHALRRLFFTGAVPLDAHHCDHADQALLVSLMVTGEPQEIAEEADWARHWYWTLLQHFSDLWEVNSWALHRRLTGGVYLDVQPPFETPSEDEEEDDGF